MNANELFAAAPELMKKWAAASLAVASSLEPALVRLVEIPCVPDQRLRQLHQYAHAGSTGEGRN